MDYTKDITPSYETIGKRRRLTGYIGEIRDGAIVLHSHEYSTYSQAETALDAIVYDLLTDLCERGLVDALPSRCITCGGDGDCPDCEWKPDAAWDAACETALAKLRSDPAFDAPPAADDPADQQRLYFTGKRRVALSS